MTVCSFCRFLGGAALLLAGVAARVDAESPAASSTSPKTSSRLVRATYAVADLVIPVTTKKVEAKGKAKSAKWEDCSTFTREMLETQLLAMIQNTIAPGTWNREGATFDYRSRSASLIVTHEPEVQKKLAEKLDDLHRQRAMTVALELRLVALPVHAVEALGKKFNLQQQAFAPAQLDDDHLQRFLTSCQGYRDCTVTQLPVAQIINGYTSRIEVPNPVAEKKVKGAPGLLVLTQPVASPDGRNVLVDLRVTQTGVSQLPLPILAAQFLGRRFPVKAGATAVLAGWTAKDGEGEQKYVAVLVTPRVSVKEEKEAGRTACTPCYPVPTETAKGKCVAAALAAQRQAQVTQFSQMCKEGKYKEAEEEQEAGACCEGKCCGPKDPKVVELLTKYRHACTEGDCAEATRLAVQALALDPTCFCKCDGGKGK